MKTQDLNGPWLNLSEVSQKTGLVKNEILYCIHTGEVMPVVYAHNRLFLAITEAAKSTVIGHATFRYSGPIAVENNVVHEIVTQNKSIVGQHKVHLLLPRNAFEWSTKYPYLGRPPNAILAYWKPRNEFAYELISEAVMHLPQEHPDYEHAECAFVEHVPENYCKDAFFDRYASQYLIRSPRAQYVYGTDHNSVYTQDNLRIPVSALSKMSQFIHCDTREEIKKTNEKVIIALPEKQRVNDLHLVIVRVLEKHPDAKSGFLWNALRRDSQLSPREFDCDECISSMSRDIIYWVSSQGTQQALKKRSFQNLVSKFRKKSCDKFTQNNIKNKKMHG